MTCRPAIAAALVAAAVALPATPSVAATKAASRSCFWARDVRNYTVPADDLMYVLVGVRDVWRLDLLGPCNNLDWPNGVAVRARGGGGMICSALDAEILYRASPMPTQTCQVRSLRKLTPEDIAALPKKARP